MKRLYPRQSALLPTEAMPIFDGLADLWSESRRQKLPLYLFLALFQFDCGTGRVCSDGWRHVPFPGLLGRSAHSRHDRPGYLSLFRYVCTGEVLMSFVREAGRAFRSTLVLWVITAIVYPFVMIGFGQLVLPYQANGSLIKMPKGRWSDLR